MAIAIALPEFSDLGRPVTHIFPAVNGHFPYRFSTFCEQIKKIYRLDVCTIEFRYFCSLFICDWWFQIPLEGLGFVKTLATIGIIYGADPLPCTKYD